MPGKFCVTQSYAKNDPDKATVGFVIANAALGSDKDTMVFLMSEGVRLAEQGYANDIHEDGFASLKELMTSFADAGGKIFVCSPCFKKRKLDETKLVAGATIVGGARLVEFLSEGASSVSF